MIQLNRVQNSSFAKKLAKKTERVIVIIIVAVVIKKMDLTG